MNRITKGLLTYMQTQTGIQVWEGEIPRYDLAGNPINPDAVVSPTVWPAVRAVTDEQGFTRNWYMGTDPYGDEGNVRIEIYGVTRDSVENTMDTIEALLASESGWANILTGQGPLQNPSYVYDMELGPWSCTQMENERLASGQIYYKGIMAYKVGMHGAVSTF